MLAKEPRFLHRFYGSSSEMMHGNKDDQFPAVGQSKIREKIKSLNFKDYHTKVRSSSIAIGLKWIKTDRGRSLAYLDPNQPKRIAFDQSRPCDKYDSCITSCSGCTIGRLLDNRKWNLYSSRGRDFK